MYNGKNPKEYVKEYKNIIDIVSHPFSIKGYSQSSLKRFRSIKYLL